MKYISAVCGAAALALALAGPASASSVIFSDDFNRADSATVGNNWVETDANDVAIAGNQLELGKNQGAAATQNNLSTLGLMNIMLHYDWSGSGAESGDVLEVRWSNDGFMSNNTLLMSEDLTTSGTDWVSLVGADNLAAISIRFEINADNGNDFAYVDNVSLEGDPKLQVPEPGTLALFGLGLAGLGFARRRKAG